MKSIFNNDWIKGIAISLISAAIVAIIGEGILYIPHVTTILSYNVPLWSILILFIFVAAATFLYKKQKSLSFLLITERTIRPDRIVTWGWELNKKTKKYVIVDFNLRCPKCKGVMNYPYMSGVYECSICKCQIPTGNPYTDECKKIVIADLKRDNPNEAHNIEEFKVE